MFLQRDKTMVEILVIHRMQLTMGFAQVGQTE